MINGIGIDIVENKRISSKLEDISFVLRILSTEEKKQYDILKSSKRKLEYLSGRFACKEAIFKALSSGDGTMNYSDISILNDEFGKPYVKINNVVKKEFYVSISHEKEYTVAQAILYT